MKNRRRTSNRNIEPHIILHLRVTEKDIEEYLNQKIQTDPLAITHLNRPVAYEPLDITAGNESFAPWTTSPTNQSSASNFPSPRSMTSAKIREDLDHRFHDLKVPHVPIDRMKDIPMAEPSEEDQSSDVKFRILDAMAEFADANKRDEWPRNTSLSCRWCCSPFTGPPVSIPRWFINQVFFVYGCYCSYSCAVAHLFFRGDITDDDRWESNHLLHLLRKKILKISETRRIEPAPPQEVLQKFGGHLSVDEFRDVTKETHNHHKVYKVLYPPMVSIVPKIEENSFKKDTEDMRILQTSSGVRAYGKMKYVAPKNENYHSRTRWGKDQPFIPVDQERVKKAVANLKIKRAKPLLDKKHTLFNYMNLKIRKKDEEMKKVRSDT